ncbi:MAG: hypothetical protein AAF772_00320 [Acidobacteriota bacterium]
MTDDSLTCADWLKVALPHLSTDLVPERRQAPLLRLGRFLPDTMHGFEVRLGDTQDEPVDLSIRVVKPRQALAVARASTSGFLRSLLKTWANGTIPTLVVPELWLEFDLPGDPEMPIERLPEPVLCAALGRQAPESWYRDSFIPAFHRAEATDFQWRQILRFGELMPEGTRPAYLFSLQARGSRGLRIDTQGMAAADMTDFVERQISPEHAGAVEAILPLAAMAENRHLSFDLMPDAFGNRVGIEASYRQFKDPRWSDLLDRLIERALCTAAQKEAILAWRGVSTAASSPALWPAGADGEPAPGFCVRAISHIKFSLKPGQPATAKAYLGIFHFVRRSPAAGR